MRRKRMRNDARLAGQRGFTMLEILITLFLLTMWLLASAGVQSSSLQFNKAAQFRTQAVYLATELAERMQANKTAAIAGSYVYSGDRREPRRRRLHGGDSARPTTWPRSTSTNGATALRRRCPAAR